jgi:hypothetical protein
MTKRLVNIFFLVVPAVTYSFDWGASVSSGLKYTSNAFLDESASVSELQREVGLSTNILHQSKASSVDGNYQLDRRYYPNSFATDTTVQGRSSVGVALLPENVTWMASHLRSDTLRDYNANDTPANRAIRESFVTGPVLSLSLTPTDSLQSSFTRSWTSTEFDPDRDNETDTKSIRYNRALNSLTNASISMSQAEISFDRALGYETNSQSISLDRKIKDGNISVTLGNNEVDQALIKSKSPLIALNVAKKLLDSGFNFSYSKMLTHTSLDVSDLGQDVPNFGLASVAEVIERETFRAGFSKSISDGISANLNAYTDTSTSKRTNLSFERKGITARGQYVRHLSPNSDVTTSYGLNYLEGGQSGFVDDSTLQSFSVSYKNSISQDLSLNTTANYFIRNGSRDNDFDQSSIGVRLLYVFR